MKGADLFALLPILIVAGAGVVILIGIAVRRSHLASLVVALVGLAAAFASLFFVACGAPRSVTMLLIIDGYALFFMGLIFAAAFGVAVLSYDYLKSRPGHLEEYYVLLLLATLGSAVLVASSHFASLFLGLELLSVSLYTLIAYRRTELNGIEAGVKYLVLAAVSASFLLFGMALVYAELGTMQFARISELLTGGVESRLMLLAALAMIIVGAGFKLALVPFHLWTPDVYQGAPAPVTAFIATVSKGAMFALLLRWFAHAHLHAWSSVVLVFVLIAISSMFVGNLLALLQDNVKRILAYSSIAHLGYLLVAFLASGPLAASAVAFYLAAYFVTTLGAFGVITVMSPGQREADAMGDYRGLAWRRPALAGVFTLMLLSLAGIPLTAGFIGKFYLLAAGVNSGLTLLVWMLIINSAIGLYYYLRIVVALYTRVPEGGIVSAGVAMEPHAGKSASGALVLGALVALLIWLGVYPATLMGLIDMMVANAFTP